MKGDFSRFTFDRRKHYAGVRLQQGRVQLDADWNEQDDLAAYQLHTLAADVIGPSGAPAVEAGGGFDLTVSGGDVLISPGRYWVDGLLCENEAEVPVTGQPDLPGLAMPTAEGRYLAYLDVWPRSVTALEDSDLLELALGGADTATRVRTVWQVKLLHLTGGETLFPAGWEPDPRPRPTLAARAGNAPRENQLYRIEVHKPGLLGEATFKWSRDNGAVAALIQNPATNSEENRSQIQITRQIGPDQAGGFATDQWIEVTDETTFLQGQPGILAKLSSVVGQVLSVEGWPGPSDPVPDLPNEPKIRRWDSDADLTATVPATNDGFLDLDGTLEVRFGGPANAYFRTGDYWVVPVRAAAGVLWPTDTSDAPLARPPHGIEHHYAPLYVLELSGSGWTATTPAYRKTFLGTTVIPGPLKLDATDNTHTTSSLTITGDLAVYKKLAVGKTDAAGGRIELVNAPLVLATGSNTDRGLQFSGTGSGSYLRQSGSRLTLGVASGSSLALRYNDQDQLTLTSNGLGLQTTSPQADVHIGGSTILVQAGTSLVIDKRLRYTDSNQKKGRVLTSDENGNATWQEPLERQLGVPKFLDLPVKVDESSGSRDWTGFTIPPDKVPADASAVIIEAIAAMDSPDSDFASSTADLKIRKTSADAEYWLLRGRSAAGGDSVAWGGQGLFPVKAGQGSQGASFQYTITAPGFNVHWRIRVVGYFA